MLNRALHSNRTLQLYRCVFPWDKRVKEKKQNQRQTTSWEIEGMIGFRPPTGDFPIAAGHFSASETLPHISPRFRVPFFTETLFQLWPIDRLPIRRAPCPCMSHGFGWEEIFNYARNDWFACVRPLRHCYRRAAKQQCAAAFIVTLAAQEGAWIISLFLPHFRRSHGALFCADDVFFPHGDRGEWNRRAFE